MAYKQIRRRTRQELGQNDGATPEVSHAPDLSQIQTDRELMTADDAMALQDLVGNRATGQIMGAATPPTPPRTGYVQPKPMLLNQDRHRERGHLPAYAKYRTPFIQAKLTVGPVNDPYEREADQVASQVVNTPSQSTAVQRVEGEELLQGKPVVQRADDAAEAAKQEAAKTKFKDNFLKFCKTYSIDADVTMADIILESLLEGLKEGEQSMSAAPKVDKASGRADKGRTIVGSETEKEGITAPEDVMSKARATGRDVFTEDNRPKRPEMYAKAQQALDIFIAHAGANLTNAIFNKVESAGGEKVVLCFWSGVGAMKTAQEQNPDGLVLEGTIGSWFDDVNIKDLTNSDVFRIDLWGSLSELYAKKAAEYHEHLAFKGYVGPDGTMTQNIFNQIESPTVVQIGKSKFKKEFHVDWFVVDCQKDTKAKWQPTGSIIAVDSREKALDYINTNYKK